MSPEQSTNPFDQQPDTPPASPPNPQMPEQSIASEPEQSAEPMQASQPEQMPPQPAENPFMQQPSQPTVVPDATLSPQMPASVPSPAAKSKNTLLIALISIIAGLILIGGVVLAIILVSAKKDEDDTPKKEIDTPAVVETTDEPKEEVSTENPDVSTTTNASGEKELTCKAMMDEDMFDVTTKFQFNKQEIATAFILEYTFSYEINDTAQQLIQSFEEAVLEELFSDADASKITTKAVQKSAHTIEVSIYGKQSDVFPYEIFNYSDGTYTTIKKSFEKECTYSGGQFSGMKKIIE